MTLLTGDWIEQLRELPEASAQMCVTSPPYWGLRDYGVAGQLGLEKTPEEYVSKLVEGFREARRVLKDNGTVWLNLGDSYNASGKARGGGGSGPNSSKQRTNCGAYFSNGNSRTVSTCKPKDLIGIPWSVAKALQSSFYSGRILLETDRVWLAATIDAEGSICGYHHTRKDDGTLRTGVHVTITNSNRAMLDNAFRIWPTSRSEHNNHGVGHFGKLDVWRWIAHDVDEKSELLSEIYPHLICKKKQALLAWNFLEMSRMSKRLGKTLEAAPMKEKRSWIVHALSKLNQLLPVDIPTWAKEPPSLFSDGWYLRSDIIWAKPNPMPESVTDRPTRSHEYIFLLSKSRKYYYNYEAIREVAESNRPDMATKGIRTGLAYLQQEPVPSNHSKGRGGKTAMRGQGHFRNGNGPANRNGREMVDVGAGESRNKRDVWSVATSPYREAHFATFPPDLIKPCILAGSRPGDTVLDPFAGSGTTGQVALELGRKATLIELNPDYCELIRQRCNVTAGLPL